MTYIQKKIIQIIHAQEGYEVIWKGEGKGEEFCEKVICFALVEEIEPILSKSEPMFFVYPMIYDNEIQRIDIVDLNEHSELFFNKKPVYYSNSIDFYYNKIKEQDKEKHE